eukprot:scaffold41494_cov595-Isochrysis_galbana.AAC.1
MKPSAGASVKPEQYSWLGSCIMLSSVRPHNLRAGMRGLGHDGGVNVSNSGVSVQDHSRLAPADGQVTVTDEFEPSQSLSQPPGIGQNRQFCAVRRPRTRTAGSRSASDESRRPVTYVDPLVGGDRDRLSAIFCTG